ncbi:MAG: right-handed parallel beta-helix repeat-containing protein [Candidatus Cloacimonetes bacterium]|nr:right-handed parallel beta-helix repeat-containing protein [Candidatus Cloacimonadota bacterium]
MKHTYLAIILILFLGSLFSVQVSGNQFGTWSPANNPYQVIGAITVPVGEVLTIESGVLVQIMGAYQITVAGNMHAEGAENDTIRFVNAQNPPTALWPGLRFENVNFSSTLDHVYIEYATYGVRSMNSPLTVSNSRIALCQKGMELYAIGAANPAAVRVEGCLIEKCIQNGIMISQNSNAIIHNNEIRLNGTGTQFYAAIQLGNQSPAGSNNPYITNNHIHHNLKQGISAWDTVGASAINPTITGNIINNNYTGVYLLNASGYIADNQIINNFIPGDMNSGAGVMVSGVTSEPYFERNTITGNYTGFYITNNGKPVLGDLSIYHAWAQGENVIANNIDANGDLHSVFCDQYSNSAFIIKAENNNWGVSTAEEIALGIRDHNDLATLPTVDFEPFIPNTLPTVINGSYSYNGQSAINNPRLELISTIDGSIVQTFFLNSQSIDVISYIDVPFYAMVVVQRVSDGQQLYGCAGGFLSPGIFYPGDFTAVDIGNIEVTDTPPPSYELVGDPILENELLLYPKMSGFALYGWQQINWLYAEGDFQYIKKHTRHTSSGDVVIDLPLGTVWTKFQNISSGDTWQQTEIIDDAGTLRVSTVKVEQCSGGQSSIDYTLFTRKDALGGVIEKIITNDLQTLRFTYLGGYTIAKEEVLSSETTEPLASGAWWIYSPLPLETTPNYLCCDPAIYNWETQSYQVRMFWQAPAFSNFNWTHYRIYRNYQQIAEIPFSQSEFIDTTFLGNETTYYEVRATDGNNNSEPSNWVLVLLVSVEDELMKPVTINVYPNPVAFSQAQSLELQFDNLKHRSAEIAIYNVKGQLVHANKLLDSDSYRWNGRDSSGLRCASGIYFLKAQVKGEKPVTKKLVVY